MKENYQENAFFYDWIQARVDEWAAELEAPKKDTTTKEVPKEKNL